MGNLRRVKFRVEVRPVERSPSVSKEALESLRDLGAKTISRMRKEVVDCPVESKTRPFVECFACENFIARSSGVVNCEGLTEK